MATHAMKQLEATHVRTHTMKMKWRMIPAMKSRLKATHAIKGNSKEVSQSGERFQSIRKDSDRSLGHTQRRKPERHKKLKYICPLGAWTHRKAIWSVILMLAKHLNSTLNNARVPEGKTCQVMGPACPFRSKHINENSSFIYSCPYHIIKQKTLIKTLSKRHTIYLPWISKGIRL